MRVDLTWVRRPGRGFGWIDHRVLSGGHLAMLDCTQVAIYLTLCLVADRHGISFYRVESLARIIKRPAPVVGQALKQLADYGLIACDGRYVQVRDLDAVAEEAAARSASPICPVVPLPVPDASTEPPEAILARLAPAEREDLLQKARQQFERFLGRREPRRSVLEAAAVGLLQAAELSGRKA